MIEWICPRCRRIETTTEFVDGIYHRHFAGIFTSTPQSKLFLLSRVITKLTLDANSPKA